MFDSLIVDVAIGLIFTFGVTAALTSAATEGIARYLGLRGDYLLRGVRSLVDGQAKKAKEPPAKPVVPAEAAAPVAMSVKLFDTPLLRSPGNEASMPDTAVAITDRDVLRKLPSYVSASSFAAAVLDLVIPDGAGDTTMDSVNAGIARLDDGVFKDSLQGLAKSASGRISTFQSNVERWYDDHMARVSGWYKRHTRWISLAVGAVIVVAFNVNAVTIARDLYTDQALRESVVTEAIAKAKCDPKAAAECIADARKEIGTLTSSGLPLGWGDTAACRASGAHCNWFEKRGLWAPARGTGANLWLLLGVIVGLLLSTLALTPGARFWFDLLSKLGTLRSSGPKPSASPS